MSRNEREYHRWVGEQHAIGERREKAKRILLGCGCLLALPFIIFAVGGWLMWGPKITP